MFETMKGGMSDIRAGLGKRDVWLALAREDVGDSHKRTRLGPAWLLLNYLLFIATMLFVFGNQQANYVVYLACGLLTWNFISETIMQSVSLFLAEEAFIKGTVLPIFVYVMRHTMRVAIRAGYALIGAIAIVLFVNGSASIGWLYSVPAMIWLLLTAPAVTIILGILGVLMPDINFFVQNFMRLAFFLTPVFWYPTSGGPRSVLYNWNPMTHYIDIFRSPVMFDIIPLHSWVICLVATALLWVVALAMLGSYRKRIVFFL
jgi:ABC-type polysaccharide/polyol phosphate export permease